MSEADDNRLYKKVITSMLNEGSEFCPFRKEKQMEYLFAALGNELQKKNQLILDACCGYGRLLHFLDEFDHDQNYVGIDYVPELVERGTQLFSDRPNVSFVCDDVLNLSKNYQEGFDISINYKTLSWFPYYRDLVRELIAVTRNKIFITSLFHDGDIDFITRIYSDASLGDADSFTYLNTYSFPKFREFCFGLGVREVVGTSMSLNFPLPAPDDINKLQTYTIGTSDGGYLEVTGTVILNWKLVEISI